MNLHLHSHRDPIARCLRSFIYYQFQEVGPYYCHLCNSLYTDSVILQCFLKFHIYINFMGNCNKKDDNQTISNFEEERWTLTASIIHPSCSILQNQYHSNVNLFKWLGNKSNTNKHDEWRESNHYNFMIEVYEVGETRRYNGDEFDNGVKMCANIEKKVYFITEALVRVKDISFTQQEAASVIFQTLLAYQILMNHFGGFVAREDMIFINKEGVIKVWVNENIAENQPEFPHPSITEREFISSIIRQVCSHIDELQPLLYNWLMEGPLSFLQTTRQLRDFIQSNQINLKLTIDKNKFNEIIKGYKIQDTSKRRKSEINVECSRQKNQPLQFIVENERGPHVRDYSNNVNPFRKSHYSQISHTAIENFRPELTNYKNENNLRKDVISVESQLVVMKSDNVSASKREQLIFN